MPSCTNVGQGLALEARDLRISLGGRQVVSGVSLRLRAGEVVGLLGPNGAGKTTIFRLLMGILRGQGQVLLQDRQETRELSGLAVHQRSRLGLGYLPQEPSVFLGLTAINNIQAVLQLRRGPASSAADLLERCGLTSVAGQKARTLSGGERRRLEIARMLALQPRLILLDEPFKGLDPQAVGDLQEVLVSLAGQGTGILLTDHNVHQALTICDRAYILVDGHIKVSGTPGNGDIPWH